jgi:hypothetical protein
MLRFSVFHHGLFCPLLFLVTHCFLAVLVDLTAIGFYILSFAEGRAQVDADLNNKGVYRVTHGSTLQPVPDVIVWQYGYVGGKYTDQSNRDAFTEGYVYQLYQQWLVYNPNLNILFLSGEAKEFMEHFGDHSFLPRAMINATFTPRLNEQRGEAFGDFGKAGILYLNTVRDERLNPAVNLSRHCPSPQVACTPMSLMHYLSTVSTSFFESFDPTLPYTPVHPGTKEDSNSNVLALLHPRGSAWALDQLHWKQQQQLPHAVAYLYGRCDRPERESFFRLLLAKELGMAGRVHALGNCNGNLSDQPNFVAAGEMLSRDDIAFSHSAVEQYMSFKFVIAFENTFVDGYITEKLTNAYFAHVIPIYLGPPDVYEFFRHESMINCNDFETLEDCAQVLIAYICFVLLFIAAYYQHLLAFTIILVNLLVLVCCLYYCSFSKFDY